MKPIEGPEVCRLIEANGHVVPEFGRFRTRNPDTRNSLTPPWSHREIERSATGHGGIHVALL